MATVHSQPRPAERTTCAWDECYASPSTMLAVPLCDRHAIKAYRAVAELLKETPKALTDMLAVTLPERILGKPQPRTDRTRRNVRTTQGTIYFAQADGLIKIGYTIDLRRRMATLGHEVLATTQGTMEDEKALHHRFGEYWERGEYFRPGPLLIAHIDTLRRNLPNGAL